MQLRIILTTIQKSKTTNIQFTTMYDEEEYKILTLQRLELENVWHFCFENDYNSHFIIKIVIDPLFK